MASGRKSIQRQIEHSELATRQKSAKKKPPQYLLGRRFSCGRYAGVGVLAEHDLWVPVHVGFGPAARTLGTNGSRFSQDRPLKLVKDTQGWPFFGKYDERWLSTPVGPGQFSTIERIEIVACHPERLRAFQRASPTVRQPLRTPLVVLAYFWSVSRGLYLDKFQKNTVRRERYSVHFLAAVVVSLILVNATIQFWPTPEESFEGMTFDTRGQEVIQIEEILQTRQEKKKPPPPVPAPPVVVPDEVTLDDIELEIQDTALTLDDGGTDDEDVEGADAGSAVASRADRSPSPVRIATPDYPREADRRNIRAEVVVEVLVDDRGRVVESRVVERFLLNKDGSEREAVQQIGYGIEESVMAAARKHSFRPAIQGGKRVQSYSTLTFRMGIDS